ncbi:hypothetical protein ElyMa_003344700 [Elysia marginata]|uniref:Peptidase S1 domain-containing protein n=1 Tax=Elysia marginata TaxID=1093978 RepID=A0AAV4JL31_9GAST|nr:hypothetical protein ElyMa_003344700 [Elysia marginata]
MGNPSMRTPTKQSERSVDPRRRILKHSNTIQATPTAALAPTVRYWLAIPSGPARNAERGILVGLLGQTLNSISLAQACTWRGHSSFAALAQIQHGESTVISPGSISQCNRRRAGR